MQNGPMTMFQKHCQAVSESDALFGEDDEMDSEVDHDMIERTEGEGVSGGTGGAEECCEELSRDIASHGGQWEHLNSV
jgi:hypothetical protein